MLQVTAMILNGFPDVEKIMLYQSLLIQARNMFDSIVQEESELDVYGAIVDTSRPVAGQISPCRWLPVRNKLSLHRGNGAFYKTQHMKRKGSSMTGNQEILDLLDGWDRQQEGYIEQREERFNVMFEILAGAFGDGFTIIDAACGPGSLSLRLLRRFPAACVIAVDADVMLLEMARVALEPHADRVRVVEADLSGPSWAEKVVEATNSMMTTAPVAMVSTTALHWLSPGDLAEFYGAAGELLQPGGIVMNGDHMRFDDRWPTLSTIARNVRQRVECDAVEKGEDDWAMWWERAAHIPRLASLKAKRDAFFASRATKRSTSGEDCPVDFHVAALRHAGFTEVGTAWQILDNYVIFGRRPCSPVSHQSAS